MSTYLAARLNLKSTITAAVPGLPVYFAGDAVPTTATVYALVSGAGMGDVENMSGLAYQTPRYQVVIWSNATSDIDAAVKGQAAENALRAAQWRVTHPRPPGFEGSTSDPKRWYFYPFDCENMA